MFCPHRQALTQTTALGLRSFIVPTVSVDKTRTGRNKSAGVIWGVLATESREEAPAAAAPAPPVAEAPAAVDEPAVSDEELLESALVAPAVAMDIARPAPSASFSAWLLQSDEAIAAVKAKALKARRDGTDPADAFSDANGACAARCACNTSVSRPTADGGAFRRRNPACPRSAVAERPPARPRPGHLHLQLDARRATRDGT